MTVQNRSTPSAARLPRVLRPPRRGMFAMLVGNGVGQAAAGVGSGYAVARVFTALSAPGGTGDTATTVALLAAGVALAAAATAWLRATEQTLAERVGQSYIHDVRIQLFDHLLAAPGARTSTGATSLRFTGDLTALRQWVSRGLARLVVAVPIVAGVLGFLAVLAPALALGGGAAVVVGLGVLVLAGQRLRGSNRHARRLRSRLAADVTERITHLPVVIANGQQQRERDRVARRSHGLRSAMLARSRDIGRLRAVVEGTLGTATAAVIAAGGFAAVPPAHVAAALTALGFLAAPLRDLGRVTEYRAAAVASTERILVMLARTQTLPSARRTLSLPDGPGRLVLDNVHVGGVLNGVNAAVEPGQVVAITGANGAGKSTLVRAVAGLTEPDDGTIHLDGTDLGKVRTRDLRESVGVVAPDLPLLRGTVERNLRYRLPRASPADVAAVRRLTRLDEVVDSLPDREKTRLTEQGANLSTGQRVRLELARALLGNPRLLLLDEADASLDSESLRLIDSILAGYAGTVLIVTHRPERVAAADTACRLVDGHLEPVHLETSASDNRTAIAMCR